MAFSWPFHRFVLWWVAFLVLTIAGERLELNRVLSLPKIVINAFIAIIVLYLAGLLLSIPYFSFGTRLNSLGMIILAFWLLRYDIALRTVHLKALPRYIAICLISGYLWLGFGGFLGLTYGGLVSGLTYDAFLHVIFVGFVISMIFGHGPIIFPCIVGSSIGYTSAFYAPPILLHLSLIVRIAGDLLLISPMRLAGGLLNGVAILFFLAIMAAQLALYRRLRRA